MNRTANGSKVRTLVAMIAITVAAALFAGCANAGSSGAKYTADELLTVWKTNPESANWDLEVRDVVSQKKSTGSHDAGYTVFLTTYTNKKVPSFKMYQTVDVPDDDSMTFEERSTAFFNAVASGGQFGGVQDPSRFMRWFAEEYPNKYFIRLIQSSGAGGGITWELIALDSAPKVSTMTGDIGRTGVTFSYDEIAKTWTEAPSQ